MKLAMHLTRSYHLHYNQCRIWKPISHSSRLQRESSFVGDPDQEDDEQLNDLLACLGVEEQKVERLKQELLRHGIDPESLLENSQHADSGSEDINAAENDLT